MYLLHTKHDAKYLMDISPLTATVPYKVYLINAMSQMQKLAQIPPANGGRGETWTLVFPTAELWFWKTCYTDLQITWYFRLTNKWFVLNIKCSLS